MDLEVVKDPSGLWRVKNAPILSTGIEYPLMTGPHTFTEEELADAVRAQQDPAIVEPRIKLGHTSDYNEALIGDAEMAFGRIDGTTMVLGDNNQTIFGDYLVPEWLGSVMAIAYPNRSIEGSEDVETVTGKEYTLIINCVSLLGIYWPGCQVLEDLPLWYGADIPDGVAFDEAIAAQLDAAKKRVKRPVAAKEGSMGGIQADADISKIRRQFYNRAMQNELEGVDVSTYWWWIRAERYGDDGSLYLIVEDDDEGDLYKFDVSVDTDEVTFSEPTPVRVEYVTAAAAERAAVVAGMAVLDPKVVVHASRADTGGPEKTTTKGASKMDEAKRKKLAASCGLPEDATEAQITARLKQIRAAAEDAGVDEGDNVPHDQGAGPDTGGPEGGGTGEDAGVHQTPPGTAPSGTAPGGDPENPGGTEQRDDLTDDEDEDDVNASTVRVDKATWKQTQADAALARKHENERIAARQLDVVNAAIKAGKIPPARRDHYVKLMAMDEQGTTAVLKELAAGAVPVGREQGNSGSGDGDGENINGGTALGLPDEWFPEVAAKRSGNDRPAAVTQAREG